MIFNIEDDIHAEIHGQYASLEAAFAALTRLAGIPWDQAPNQCPCTSWRTCGRHYKILEYDNIATPWILRRRLGALSVSSHGTAWSEDFTDGRLSDPRGA